MISLRGVIAHGKDVPKELSNTMATDSNLEYWRNIGSQLRHQYAFRYLTHQPFMKGHFLEPVVPFDPKFFGTKVLNILIIDKPWTWDEEFEDYTQLLISLIRRNFNKWPFYLVDIYIDYLLAERALANFDNTGYIAKLDGLALKIQTLCTLMADCGFRYKGKITGTSGQPDFYLTIPDFYNLPEL